jgi:type II secretory pathway pseudopilin PulG
MFCNNCGTANADTAAFCVNCGTRLLAPTTVVNPSAVMGSAAAPAPAQPPAPVANAWLAPQPPRTSGKAVASLVLGIVNALGFFLFFPVAILAVVFGHLGRNEVKQSQGAVTGGGMAMTGLVLGYMSVLTLPILLIAAIAIPNLLAARKSANEASAVGSLRTINTACISYSAAYPKKGFPASLRALGPAENGPESEDGAGLIDPQLVGGVRSGYAFSYTPGPPNADGVILTYTVTADPLKPETGRRHFFTDESAVIRAEEGTPANADSPPL